jgi:photosystem II stability/assembly factor-like uncharacterized protein
MGTIICRSKSILFFFLLLSTGFILSAQTSYNQFDNLPGVIKSYKPSFDQSFPNWAKMMYQNNINYYEINKAFEEYMEVHPGEKSAIIRYFKIWRRACLPFVDDLGNIQIPDQTNYLENLNKLQAEYKTRKPTHSKSASDWSFVGPKETYWLNETGTATPPAACPWQVNVYAFDVASTNDSIIYCGTETGFVNKTTDKGLNWLLQAPDYYFGGAVTAVAVSPINSDVAFVSAGNQIHKTMNGGASWTPLLSISNLFAADRLRIDPQNPSKIFAAADNGLYMSNDDGATWVQKWTGQVYDVEVRPGDSNTVFALTKTNGNFSVINSGDAGISFQIDQGFPATYAESSGGLLAVTPDNPDIVYAVLLSTNNTPYLIKGSLNTGAWSWMLKATGQTPAFNMNNGQGYFDLVLEISPLDENIILVGTTTLFKSLNGANSFTAVGGYYGNFKIHPDIQDIKMLPSGETWVSTDGGMNFTTDNFNSIGNHVARINGLIGSDMWGFDQGWNEDVVVGGRYHNGNTAIADFYQPKALRMGGAESPTGWVLQGKSRHVAFNDLGNGWILPKTATGMPEGRFIFSKYPNMEEYGGRRGNLVFHPNYSGTLYLGEGTGFWISTDMGITWDLLHNFSNTVRYIQISYHNPDIIYADVVNAGLCKSTDGGITWTIKPSLTAAPNGTSNWKGKLFFSISPYDENTIYACLQNGTWSADIGKVFKSQDGGDTWTDWTGSLSEYLKCMVVQPSNNQSDIVYLFTNARNGNPAGVFYRKSTMSDWLPYDINYPAGMTVNMALPFFRDSKLRVAGNCGVWESPMETIDFSPIINPWVDKPHYNCMLDTVFFDDHSILNHNGVTWHWDFNPAPVYVENPDMRNPKVVLGNPGAYDVTLTVSIGGQNYVKTIPGMVTTTTCPSIEDCSNPAALPKNLWSLIYVDSEETNDPGLATMSFDDDPATIWHTRWSTGDDPYPHEIQIDLGSSYKISDFTYLPRQDGENGRIKDYELYISQDSLNWGIPVKTGQFLNSASPHKVTLDSAIIGHYFRLKALSEVNGNPWASAAEFSLTGCKNNVGIDDQFSENHQIIAFPIPTNDNLKFTLPGANNYSYRIVSLKGQILENGIIHKNEQSASFNFSLYKPGLYFVLLTSENGQVYRIKVIKD